jgi:hypothetical protein
LEAFFRGNPAGHGTLPAARPAPASVSNEISSQATFALPTTVTNSLAPASTNVALPEKSDPPPTMAWPEGVAKSVTGMGYRLTYWLLLLLLLVVIGMEIQRRRRKARKRVSQEESS